MKILRRFRVDQRREMAAGRFSMLLEDLQAPGSAVTLCFKKPELSPDPKSLDVVASLSELPELDEELVLVRAKDL